MLRPARPRLLPLLALSLCGSLAGAPALASSDPDDPPPLMPIRDPAPVEPQPRQIVLAWAAWPDCPPPGPPPATPGTVQSAGARL